MSKSKPDLIEEEVGDSFAQLEQSHWNSDSAPHQALAFKTFIYLFNFGYDLLCFVWALSSCSKWELLFLAVHGLFTAVASLASGHRLQVYRLSTCDTRA